MRTEVSARLFDRARQVIPGGVNSPVRAFDSVGGVPRFIARGEGAELVDVDGNPIPNAKMRLEAVHPDRVPGALYPGLGESPVAVRIPIPAQLLRVGKTDAQGRFEFALGDHPQGTGHLLLTADVKGKRSARREVKTVGKSFRIVMQDIRRRGLLQLQRRDGGPIPASEITLDGEPRDNLSNLEQGFYRIVIKRGDLLIRQADKLWIENQTGFELKP